MTEPRTPYAAPDLTIRCACGHVYGQWEQVVERGRAVYKIRQTDGELVDYKVGRCACGRRFRFRTTSRDMLILAASRIESAPV